MVNGIASLTLRRILTTNAGRIVLASITVCALVFALTSEGSLSVYANAISRYFWRASIAVVTTFVFATFLMSAVVQLATSGHRLGVKRTLALFVCVALSYSLLVVISHDFIHCLLPWLGSDSHGVGYCKIDRYFSLPAVFSNFGFVLAYFGFPFGALHIAVNLLVAKLGQATARQSRG